MRITAALKGVITAILMIAIALAVYYYGGQTISYLQYFLYVIAIYALGIIWTLIVYKRSANFTGKFADLFGQGFRCFIVVVLMMVTFTFIFNKIHPEIAEEAGKAYKEALLKEKIKDKTPAEIDEAAESYKNRYTTVLIYGAIFGYLIIGAGVTAAASALLMRRNS